MSDGTITGKEQIMESISLYLDYKMGYTIDDLDNHVYNSLIRILASYVQKESVLGRKMEEKEHELYHHVFSEAQKYKKEKNTND